MANFFFQIQLGLTTEAGIWARPEEQDFLQQVEQNPQAHSADEVAAAHEVTVLPPSEPVQAEVPELVPAPQKTPAENSATPARQPTVTLEQARRQVWEMFSDYVDLLDAEDFYAATQLRKQIRQEKIGSHSGIWILEQYIADGELDEYIPVEITFQWQEGGNLVSSSYWQDVPEKKRATSLLFALHSQAKNKQEVEREMKNPPTLTQGEVPSYTSRPMYRNPITGFNGRQTGKTEREKAKRKVLKPERVGPAKGTSPGKPRHGH